MHIDKFKNEDGSYTDERGLWHEDAAGFLQHTVGFCACGRPEASLKYIAASMRILYDNHTDKSCEGLSWDHPDRKARYEAYRKRIDEHFKSEGAEYFMFYWLATKDYTEHGGSVPGWLTPAGIELMEDIEALNAEDDDAEVAEELPG